MDFRVLIYLAHIGFWLALADHVSKTATPFSSSLCWPLVFGFFPGLLAIVAVVAVYCLYVAVSGLLGRRSTASAFYFAAVNMVILTVGATVEVKAAASNLDGEMARCL